ncbi:MAG: hypothetical protein SNJ58_05955 [Aggregatilineales bacterium]
MKVSFYKSIVLALISLLLLTPALTVSAQDCPPGIGASDCALIASATGENAGKLASFVMDFTVDAVIKGVEGGDVMLAVKGSGGIDISKLNLMASDPVEALAGLVFRAAMDASLKGGGQEQSGTVEIRIVDGQVYFKGFDGTDTWQQQPADDLFSQLGLGDTGGSDMGDLGGLLGNLGNPALSGLFGAIQTVYTASDGPTIEVSTRAIVATTDLKPLLQALADPTISDALSQIIPQDDPNVAQIGSLLPLLSALFKEAKIVATQYYGTDGTFRGLKFELSLVVDGMMASMLTNTPNDIEVQFALDVRLSKLGEPYTVEVPIN